MNRGLTLHQLGRYDDAVAALRQAIECEPRYLDAYRNLSFALEQQGRLDDAAEALRAALRIDPHCVHAHIDLGHIQHECGQRAEAKASFDRALAIDPDAVIGLTGLAALLHDEERFADSEQILKRVLTIKPDHTMALINLGLVRQEQDDAAGAVDAFTRALTMDPANKRAQAHLGIALQQCGRQAEARAIFDFDRLITVSTIDSIAGWPTVRDFNAELSHYVISNPTLLLERPAVATTKGSQTLEMLGGESRLSAALRDMIDAKVRQYIDTTLSGLRNTYASQVAPKWRLTGWAVVLHSGGYQSPHIHPRGFASGVYYVRIPEVIQEGSADRAGHIAFGLTKPWATGKDAQDHFLTRSIAPIEGRLVLFPSHFWHYTIPFESGQNRICVAFDVVPV